MDHDRRDGTGQLSVRVRRCPACDAEGAECIEFDTGRVIRCEACDLQDLEQGKEEDDGANA